MCRIVWYYIYTYYIWASVEMGIIHSQNGWYFLEAWIVLQVSHLLKRPKVELWRLSVVLAIHVWHSVKTNGKHLKNNLSPRDGCCWAINRGLVSVHVNVYSANHIDVASSKRTCFAHYIGHWNWLYFTAIWATNARYLYKTLNFWPLWHKIGTSFSEVMRRWRKTGENNKNPWVYH